MATDSELKAEKLKKAREANADRNKSRLEKLEAIADGSEEDLQDQMAEQDDKGNLVPQSKDDNKLNADGQTDTPDGGQNEDQGTQAAADDTQSTTEAQEANDNTSQDGDQNQQANGEDGVQEPSDEKVVNGTRYYLTIVNGKEKWLTKNQLIEKAQKVESADEYLQNAAESARTIVRPDLSATDDTGSVEEDDTEAFKKQLGSAVLGDQEAINKIASSFSDLRKQLQEAKKAQPSVNPDVVKEIDSRLAFRNAVDWFEGEYSKELGDPILKKLMYDKDAELANSSPNMPYKERLKKAGEEVRSWANTMKGVQAKVSPEKVDRKQTIVNVPTASQRQQSKVEDDEEEDVSDTIQKMAQSRNQPRAIVHRGPLNK